MTDNPATALPMPLSDEPQGAPAETTTSTPPTLDEVNTLWADLHAGRIAMTDSLTRLAAMQAAFLGI